MDFIKAIEAAWEKNNSLVCVGLDSDLDRIPAPLRERNAPLFEFNKAIVEVTADLVCAYPFCDDRAGSRKLCRLPDRVKAPYDIDCRTLKYADGYHYLGLSD